MGCLLARLQSTLRAKAESALATVWRPGRGRRWAFGNRLHDCLETPVLSAIQHWGWQVRSYASTSFVGRRCSQPRSRRGGRRDALVRNPEAAGGGRLGCRTDPAHAVVGTLWVRPPVCAPVRQRGGGHHTRCAVSAMVPACWARCHGRRFTAAHNWYEVCTGEATKIARVAPQRHDPSTSTSTMRKTLAPSFRRPGGSPPLLRQPRPFPNNFFIVNARLQDDSATPPADRTTASADASQPQGSHGKSAVAGWAIAAWKTMAASVQYVH